MAFFPVRAFLLVAAATAASAGSAFAQGAADKATDAAIACLDLSDPSARLSCLESATREIKATRVRKETAAEESVSDAAGPVIAAEGASEEDLFGAEALDTVKRAKTEKRKSLRLTQKVVEMRVNSRKELTAVLENGQVWRQLSSDNKSLHVGRGDKLYTVTIKKGALGNYMMKINELKQTIRVRRIK